MAHCFSVEVSHWRCIQSGSGVRRGFMIYSSDSENLFILIIASQYRLQFKYNVIMTNKKIKYFRTILSFNQPFTDF